MSDTITILNPVKFSVPLDWTWNEEACQFILESDSHIAIVCPPRALYDMRLRWTIFAIDRTRGITTLQDSGEWHYDTDVISRLQELLDKLQADPSKPPRS